MASIAWNPLENHWDTPLAPALFNTPKDCIEGALAFNYVHEERSVQIFECEDQGPPSVFEAGSPMIPTGGFPPDIFPLTAPFVVPGLPPIKTSSSGGSSSPGGSGGGGGFSLGSTFGSNPVSEEIFCCYQEPPSVTEVPVAVVPLPSGITLMSLPLVLILVFTQIARRPGRAAH